MDIAFLTQGLELWVEEGCRNMEASCLGVLGCRVCVPESYMSAMEDFSLLLDREAHIVLGYDAQEAVARNEGQGFLVSFCGCSLVQNDI